jgi:microcystin-dependent protein
MDPYIAEIELFAGNFPPTGWFFCDGTELPIAQYQVLFAVIGNRFGGNGTTSFKLPDLRGRAPIGFGSGMGLTPRDLGASGGAESVAIGLNQLPIHNHPAQTTMSGSVTARINGVSEVGTQPSPSGTYIAGSANSFLKNGTLVQMNAGSVTVDASGLAAATSINNAGAGGPHENMPPFLAINFIIAWQGIFPSHE